MDNTSPSTYWNQPAEILFDTLRTHAAGLTSEEAQMRLAQIGPNALEARAEATPLRLFLKQFQDPIVLILLFATGISAVTQEWVDAIIILLIVLGSATLSFFQEYSAGNAAAKLRDQVAPKTTVLRGGQALTVPAVDIVPGDVVLLSAGSLIPADGVLLTATDFYVNQAVLTGETFPVEKMSGVVAQNAGLPERTNCVGD